MSKTEQTEPPKKEENGGVRYPETLAEVIEIIQQAEREKAKEKQKP